MAEPFKELINREAIEDIAARLCAAYPSFDAPAFVIEASRDLGPLALKARVKQVALALRAALPAQWPEALRLLVAALPPPLEGTDGTTGGMRLWPLLQVVEDHGLADPERSLVALREMTRRFSAEFAIRPLLRDAPEPAWAALARWVGDPDPHVRRLVSEGSRPKLPWGLHLPADGRARPLLDRLADDPSDYVRRSVANHVGDLGKLDPDGTVAWMGEWLARAPSRRALVTHGLRDLLKKGHPGALRLLGQGDGGVSVLALRLTSAALRVGEALEVEADVTVDAAVTVRIDLVWSWPGARAGAWSSRTFRGAVRAVAAGERWRFTGRVSTRPVSTRPLRPGPQRLHLRVNGDDHGPLDWILSPP